MSRSTKVIFSDQYGFDRILILRLSDESVVPIFEQLRAQISVMIAVGRLEPGCRLPTVRSMAQQLALAPGTVARTYRELDNDRSLSGRGRRGSFVSDAPPHSEPLLERQRRLEDSAHLFASVTQQLGISKDDAIAAYQNALSRITIQESDTENQTP